MTDEMQEALRKAHDRIEAAETALAALQRTEADVKAAVAMRPAPTPIDGQLTRADLKTMTPDEIVQAKADGRLNTVLGIPLPFSAGHHYTREDIRQLTAERRYDEIERLRSEGRLNHLLNSKGYNRAGL